LAVQDNSRFGGGRMKFTGPGAEPLPLESGGIAAGNGSKLKPVELAGGVGV
jgi:hypothetical protein